jgi:hypothetical protein
MRLTRRPGVILLAIWLILHGLIVIFNISFTAEAIVMALIAIAAGILLFVERW